MKQLNWYQIFGVQIPDGRTVLPTDDIQIWLNCANIWDKNYTTLAEVLADSTTLSALISSNNAVDYLVRSTTFIGNTALVPVMTDNTHPSGVASASSTYVDANAPYKAFDGNTSTFHSWVANQTGNYLRYDFGHSVALSKYSFVMNRYQATSAGTKNLAIQISDDAVTWTNLDTFSVAGGSTDFTRDQDISGIHSFRYIQIYTNDIMRPTGNAWNMSTKEFQIYSLGLVLDSTAMTYIGLNNYCANTLLADSTWRTAICNSAYFESVLNVKVPTMTSNITPSGVASYSGGTIQSGAAFNVFDNNVSTYLHLLSNNLSTPTTFEYQFDAPHKIIMATVYPLYINGAGNCVKNYKIQGYDGNSWLDLCATQTMPNVSSAKATVVTLTSNLGNYAKYRLMVNDSYYIDPYTSNKYIDVVRELQFYGREDV